VDAEAGFAHGALSGLVGYNLRRSDVYMREQFIRTLADWNIRPAQYSVMTLIAANPSVTQSGIAEALSIQRPNLVGIVMRLEKRGLIRRVVSESDRRSQVLSLTPRGRSLLEELNGVIAAMDRRVTSCWTDAERSTLVSLLQRLWHQKH
jgi:DNA-binding MarR family transcriptional regulator